MRTAAIVGATLVLLATPTLARDQVTMMPKQFIGYWCPGHSEANLNASLHQYQLVKKFECRDDTMVISNHSLYFVNDEAECRVTGLIELSIGGILNKYLVHMSCQNRGSKERWPLQIGLTPAVEGQLLMDIVTQEAKK